jgi:hypothetical protein
MSTLDIVFNLDNFSSSSSQQAGELEEEPGGDLLRSAPLHLAPIVGEEEFADEEIENLSEPPLSVSYKPHPHDIQQDQSRQRLFKMPLYCKRNFMLRDPLQRNV